MKPAENLKDKKIAVLMGGCSRERSVSLRSGQKILASLKKQGYRAAAYDLNNIFFRAVINKEVEVVFIALHGSPGEDGSVQGFLETAGMPYTGCGVLSSALAMDKLASKKIMLAHNISTPEFFELDGGRPLGPQVEQIVARLGLPLVIKPVTEGSSFGVSIVSEKSRLIKLLKNNLAEFGRMMAEKFIKGTEITVGVIGALPAVKVLPVLELVPRGRFYDYKSKYTPGETRFIIPARLSPAVTRAVTEAARRAFCVLGCHGMARIDMIVRNGRPFVHDINTIPGMTDLSDLPAQARAAGISYDRLVVEILSSAFRPRA